MNRRKFLATSIVGVSAVALSPVLKLIPVPVPLYKQFDWLKTPVSLVYSSGNYRQVDPLKYVVDVKKTLIVAKTTRLHILTPADIDLTQEFIIEDNFKYYTNNVLLTQAKFHGLTHIYNFTTGLLEYRDGTKFRWYWVRGAKMPNWKSENEKINDANI